MLKSRTHITITKPANPHCICFQCRSNPSATVIMRVCTTHDAETMNFTDVYMCDDCIRDLSDRLIGMLPLPPIP